MISFRFSACSDLRDPIRSTRDTTLTCTYKHTHTQLAYRSDREIIKRPPVVFKRKSCYSLPAGVTESPSLFRNRAAVVRLPLFPGKRAPTVDEEEKGRNKTIFFARVTHPHSNNGYCNLGRYVSVGSSQRILIRNGIAKSCGKQPAIESSAVNSLMSP